MDGTSKFAKVINTNDHYPFGLDMKGRTWKDENAYRYGFNGKKKGVVAKHSAQQNTNAWSIFPTRIRTFVTIEPPMT